MPVRSCGKKEHTGSPKKQGNRITGAKDLAGFNNSEACIWDKAAFHATNSTGNIPMLQESGKGFHVVKPLSLEGRLQQLSRYI